MTAKDWAYPIPEHRRHVYAYYKLTFAPDGCPMKRGDTKDVFHPILPAYLIKDYVRWKASSRSDEYIELARKVARLALARGERRGDALVFVYEPASGLSSVPVQFYSALTQAWYIDALCALSRYVNGEFDDEIRSIFRSLLIPMEEGGCLLRKSWGWVVEEYPHDPPLYTLNGWLTVICMLLDAREYLTKIGLDIEEFLRENLNAVEHLLPLYDAEFCANSRYQLTGFTRLRLLFDKPVSHSLSSFEVTIPGEGTYPGALAKADSRWKPYVERSEPRLLQMNVVQSLVCYPEENVFRAILKVDLDCKAKLMAAVGEWRHDMSAMPTDRWREVASFFLKPGEHTLEVPITWDDQNVFAYPTNFKKRVNGVLFNAYHFIHIQDLAQLYAHTGKEVFKEWAERWMGYPPRWPTLAATQSKGLSFQALKGDETLNLIAKLLRPSLDLAE
jgi:hypothetical protein